MTDVTVPRIRPEIAADAVPIEDVTPYPGNARRGNLDKIRTSLRNHGQYKHLLVDQATGFILVGNNTYAAMREEGYEQVAVLRLEVDEGKARELLLIDNASSDEAIYDEAALAALLADVQEWEPTGWTPDDLDDLLVGLEQAAAGDPDALAAALPAGVAPPQTLPEVPSTDARYSEDPDAEQARQQRLDTWVPRYAKGMTEVILVYPEDVRTAVLELIGKCRARLDPAARNGDVIHGALRLLAEVVEADARGDLAVDVAAAIALGTPPDDDDTAAAAAAADAEAHAQQAADQPTPAPGSDDDAGVDVDADAG